MQLIPRLLGAPGMFCWIFEIIFIGNLVWMLCNYNIYVNKISLIQSKCRAPIIDKDLNHVVESCNQLINPVHAQVCQPLPGFRECGPESTALRLY